MTDERIIELMASAQSFALGWSGDPAGVAESRTVLDNENADIRRKAAPMSKKPRVSIDKPVKKMTPVAIDISAVVNEPNTSSVFAFVPLTSSKTVSVESSTCSQRVASERSRTILARFAELAMRKKVLRQRTKKGSNSTAEGRSKSMYNECRRKSNATTTAVTTPSCHARLPFTNWAPSGAFGRAAVKPSRTVLAWKNVWLVRKTHDWPTYRAACGGIPAFSWSTGYTNP
mmetsp:Transcript_5906/g.9979  ORF Transcript_5906/g.9979 Transcript_5906/m.9979 type:complete len:230 (-) Transcript_5906:227-916(-)